MIINEIENPQAKNLIYFYNERRIFNFKIKNLMDRVFDKKILIISPVTVIFQTHYRNENNSLISIKNVFLLLIKLSL